jgi:hypothetical protein
MTGAAPRWLLGAGIVLLLWNLMGTSMFALDMMKTPADIAALPQDQQTLWAQMPVWGWVGYGLGTIAELLAALGIVLKKRWATIFALLSVVGVIANFLPTFAMSKGVDVWQPKFFVFPLVIFAIALFQLCLARRGNARGWNS